MKQYKLLLFVCAVIHLLGAKDQIGVGTLTYGKNAKKYIDDVFNSGRLSYGPYLRKMEKMFAQVHDSKFAVVSNSGTSALQVALQALKEVHGWQDGDEVIVPSVTFVATVNIVIHNNMKPVFVDVDPFYYEMDPTYLEKYITQKTRVIIPVHLFGHPCNMVPIRKIADKYNLKIIEDSCETMLARDQGKSVGNLGDIGCFSTYIAHLLTTGVGGLCTTNNSEYAVKIRSLVNHGRDSIYIAIDDDKNLKADELKEVIARRFSFVSVGHSFRITEFEGALGVAGLEDLEEHVQLRRANAAYLIAGLKDLEGVLQLPQIRPGAEHSFMMFPIVLKKELKVNCVNFLEQNGIETRDMLPLINQPIYQKMFSLKEGDFPVADWINNYGFYIGCHQELTKKELDHIINSLHCFFMKNI